MRALQHAACQVQPRQIIVISHHLRRRWRPLDLPGFRQLSVFRQSTNLATMPSSLETQQLRARLRVGQRFLRLRPRIAGVAALGNAAVLSASSAPGAQ